jgi:serine protease Do
LNGYAKDLTKTERGSRSGGGTSLVGRALVGVTVENLTPDIARRVNLSPATRGVVVDDLDYNSNAARAGLRVGDVVEKINRQPISNVSDFNAALQKAGKEDVLLRVRRARQGAFFLVIPAHE